MMPWLLRLYGHNCFVLNMIQYFQVLLTIPLNELTNNTAQFLSLVDNIHFDLTSDEGIIPAEFELTTQIDTTGMETTQSDEYLGAEPELAVDGSNRLGRICSSF